MDGGDILFIIIVTILGIISSVSRNKKEAAKRAMKQTEAEEPKNYSADQPVETPEKQVEGRYAWPQQPNSGLPVEDTMSGSTSNPHDEGKTIFYGMETPIHEIQSVEYEVPLEPASEEELYAPEKYEELDKIPTSSGSSLLDQPVSPYETTYEGLGSGYQPIVFEEEEEGPKAPDMIFEYEKVLKLESELANVMDDFDPAKAIIYSEVINKKYF